MTLNYRVGFPDKETQCLLTEKNPGFPPVVETGGPFAFGRVVCICDSESEAQLIADLLNLNHAMKQSGWRRP